MNDKEKNKKQDFNQDNQNTSSLVIAIIIKSAKAHFGRAKVKLKNS